VLNKRLEDRDYLAGEYSIADIASYSWAKLWERQGQDIAQFPNMQRWLERIYARPAVKRGLAVNAEDRKKHDLRDPAIQAVLFGQRAR
ncbi:MAG TPA: glutathione binding-like protein, partial [Enterovirga sp.]|nr:glutathione binding-like protein [Enterovirga sp.]